MFSVLFLASAGQHVMLLVFLIILVTILSLIYYLNRLNFTILKRHGFLQETPTFFYGNFHYKYHAAVIISELYEKFKNQALAFGFYFLLTPGVVLTDLKVIEDIFENDVENFSSRGMFYNKKDDPLSAHMLSLDGEEWKQMRKKLSPFFSSQKMKLIFRTVLNVSNYTMQNLEFDGNSKMFEVKELLSRNAIDVIGNVVYGIDMNAINSPNSKFRKMGLLINDYRTYSLPKVIMLIYFMKLSKFLRLKFIPENVSDFFLGVVRTTVIYRLQNKIKRNDMIGTLLQAEVAGNSELKISLNEIAAHCFAFFLYGCEPLSSTYIFAVFELAKAQEIQNKLRKEILVALEKNEGKMTYEFIESIKYLQMVIDETLRKYPPIYNVLRRSVKRYQIAKTDLVIPRDTYVMVPVYSIHNDADYYPEPHVFDPERFSDENKGKRHPLTFIPFGLGHRSCIGFRFGLMQIKIILIQLVLKFRIQTNQKTPNLIRFHVHRPILTPKSKVWLTFEKIYQSKDNVK